MLIGVSTFLNAVRAPRTVVRPLWPRRFPYWTGRRRCDSCSRPWASRRSRRLEKVQPSTVKIRTQERWPRPSENWEMRETRSRSSSFLNLISLLASENCLQCTWVFFYYFECRMHWMPQKRHDREAGRCTLLEHAIRLTLLKLAGKYTFFKFSAWCTFSMAIWHLWYYASFVTSCCDETKIPNSRIWLI
jgi:hypothetical protein